MKKEVKIPNVFYYYIHSRIWERVKGRETLKSDLRGFLAEWRIPKKLRPLIIKELDLLGLIKNGKRHMVEINKPVFEEEEINKYYKKLKIF